MEFVPYDQFKDIEFIAEGGFSKLLGLMAQLQITIENVISVNQTIQLFSKNLIILRISHPRS